MHKLALNIILSAIVASVYSVLSCVIGPLGYSWVQFRVGEALTPLPFILGLPAVIGLTLGCVITNLVSPVGLPDLIFGSGLTFVAAIFSWKLSFGKPVLACLYPIIVNTIGVSAYLSAFFGVPYLLTVLTVGVGEFGVIILIGYPILMGIKKYVLQKITFKPSTKKSC